jgi:hypothetical protein
VSRRKTRVKELKLPSLAERHLVLRRCPVCDWQVERIEDASADPECPQCHAPTAIDDVLPLPTGVDLSGVQRAKNIYAAALGRLGGLKGGKARARTLSAARRKEIARKAARARWKKR